MSLAASEGSLGEAHTHTHHEPHSYKLAFLVINSSARGTLPLGTLDRMIMSDLDWAARVSSRCYSGTSIRHISGAGAIQVTLAKHVYFPHNVPAASHIQQLANTGWLDLGISGKGLGNKCLLRQPRTKAQTSKFIHWMLVGCCKLH